MIHLERKEKRERSAFWLKAIYAALCSFAVYFCMYAFRKPFTAASFDQENFLGIDYKIWLVTAQVLGYTISKFYGIRFISGLMPDKRALTIIVFILISWIALLLFALVPPPFNIVLMFINGFPLGMIWGLVFSYIEGRKATEFMGATLAVSFIFSSGVVKTVGKYVTQWGVSEWWMPFVTGSLFFLPLLLFTWLLNKLPAPTAEDRMLRTERKPMTKDERRSFLTHFFPGIAMIVLTYTLLTALRDFRDNFANELWEELGFGSQPSIFTTAEVPVALIVLFCVGSLFMIKNNLKAFFITHYIIIAGYLISVAATFLFMNGLISPLFWMIAVGVGLYLSYVPFNCIFFERLIATYRVKSNVGFLMYIADSFGYLGSVLVLFMKNFVALELSWSRFFSNLILVISIVGIAGTALSLSYFRKKYISTSTTTAAIYAI